VGELLLEGPILARCYLNNPKETAEVFIEDLSWARKADLPLGRRFYRTSDLVRYQSDGTIKFIGRNDTQVKVRGQRVELSEIEYHLARLLPSPIKVVVEMVQFQHAANNETKLVAFLGEDFAWVGLDNVNGDVASTLLAKVETSDQEHFIRFIQFSTQLHNSVIFCLSRNSAAVNIRKGGPKAVASNRRGTIQRATCCSCHSVQKPANSFNKDRETSARSVE
jgi:acyl-CoA synthetase (AMP-forming)/AMP-acid ligase II